MTLITNLSKRQEQALQLLSSEDLTTLRLKYRELCSQLVSSIKDTPELRWCIFCNLAQFRRQFLSILGGDKAFIAVSPSDNEAEKKSLLERRAQKLLRGILIHFQDVHLDLEINGEHDFEANLERIITDLEKNKSFEASERRTRVQNGKVIYRTTQEDVLSQELRGIQGQLENPKLEQVLNLISFIRSRDKGNVLWNLIGELIVQKAKEKTKGPVDVFSIGSGVAQFEEQFSKRGIPTTALDFDDWRSEEEQQKSDITFIKKDFSDLQKEEQNPSSILIIGDVLHHTENPQAFLKKSLEFLKEDGVLFLIEPRFEKEDELSGDSLRELDSTDFPSSIKPVSDWEEILKKQNLEKIVEVDVPPGVIDNGDSFPRRIWLLRRSNQLTP